MVNLEPADDSPVNSDCEIIFPEIPAYYINKDFRSYIYTGDSNEEPFLNSLNITFQDFVKIEKDTRNLSDCSLWFELRKPRITSSKCHRILILYVQKLSIPVLVHETGLVIQPSLFWLAASPDGLVAYQTSDKKLLLEIKRPHTKRPMSPTDLIQGRNFYVNLENGKPVLKKSHSTRYYSQIQLAIELSGFDTCDFVAYTFEGLIIVRTAFDVSYFDSLIQKLNSFYKKFMLPRMVSSLTN